MKKFLCFALVAVLTLSPVAVFAENGNGENGYENGYEYENGYYYYEEAEEVADEATDYPTEVTPVYVEGLEPGITAISAEICPLESVEVRLVDGVEFVRIRAAANAFGFYYLYWDGETYTVTIVGLEDYPVVIPEVGGFFDTETWNNYVPLSWAAEFFAPEVEELVVVVDEPTEVEELEEEPTEDEEATEADEPTEEDYPTEEVVVDAALVGTWHVLGEVIYVFNADGTGYMLEVPISWSSNDGILTICVTPELCEAHGSCLVPMDYYYTIEGDVLTIISTSFPEIELTLTRQ